MKYFDKKVEQLPELLQLVIDGIAKRIEAKQEINPEILMISGAMMSGFDFLSKLVILMDKKFSGEITPEQFLEESQKIEQEAIAKEQEITKMLQDQSKIDVEDVEIEEV